MSDDDGTPIQREHALVSAWVQAAEELGLAIERDVTIAMPDGDVVVWPLLVRGFGSSKGILLAPRNGGRGERRHRQAAAMANMNCSFLSPKYEIYDRDLFQATLDDWGWRAGGSPPDWYTGAPWTQ